MNKEDGKGISKELMLRDNRTGQWIKRSDEELSLSDNCIPRTFIQVVNNEIHYADTSLIISEMLKNRNKEKVEFLETKYNNILDFLDQARTYSTSLDKVFNECSSTINDFDNEIRRIANRFDGKEINELDCESFVNVANAHIKILFVYLYAAFSLYKEKVKDDGVICEKIQNLKSYVQSVLESFLIPKDWRGDLDYSLSLYPMFIYSEYLNIRYIETLVKYDRRFTYPLELVRIVNNFSLNITSDRYSSEFEFRGAFEKMKPENPKIVFIEKLIKLLGDIDRLEHIREEIGSIDDMSIFKEFDMHVNK